MFRLVWLHLRVAVMNEFQYRANFFVQLFQSLIALGTGLAVLALVFSRVGSLNGWSRPQLLAVMGVFTIMGGLIHAVIQPNVVKLLADVQDGNLDHVLTKPVDAQLLSSVRTVQLWQGVDVLIGLAVLAVSVVQLGSGLGVVAALEFVTALGLGAVMVYSFWMIMATLAFWVVRMDEVAQLFEGVYQAGRFPVSIYPGWLRIGLTFLVPVAFAVTAPAEGVTGRLTGTTLLGAFGLAALLFAAARWFWRFGLRNYTGASA